MNKKYLSIVSFSLGILLFAAVVFIMSNTFGVSAGMPYLLTGRDTVTTTGMAVNLDALIVPRDTHFLVKASATNTDPLGIAYSSATSPATGTDSFRLYPGESVGLNISNADLLWINGTAGDGCEFITEFTY